MPKCIFKTNDDQDVLYDIPGDMLHTSSDPVLLIHDCTVNLANDFLSLFFGTVAWVHFSFATEPMAKHSLLLLFSLTSLLFS